MKVTVSVAVSLDGYLNDASGKRLKLSSPEDWADVLTLRAECDAILVGAGTIRADNPSLVIKDEKLRKERVRKGMNTDIVKVCMTESGKIDPAAKFFTEGSGEKIVFLSNADAAERFEGLATVIVSDRITPRFIVQALAQRGLEHLLVEGGSNVLTRFFAAGAVDRLRLAIAPFFVGDSRAPRFLEDAEFVNDKDNRMTLDGVRKLGDMAVMDYTIIKPEDVKLLKEAIEESRKCVPSISAYCVGAVIETLSGKLFRGYTHETNDVNHAEEEAVAKALAAGEDLRGATIFSSMEPCSKRNSKPLSCSEIIIRHGFSKVVFAYYEPAHFVDCDGRQMLENAGIDVVVIEDLAGEVEAINSHILGK